MARINIPNLDSVTGRVPASQISAFTERYEIAPNTAYSPGDIVSYAGRRVLITSAVTTGTGTPPFLSASHFEPLADTWVNARAFGAQGNGTADDTAALQTALDWVGSGADGTGGGGTVFLPAGYYQTSSTLILGKHVTLRGEGMTASVIKLATNANCDVITNRQASSGGPNNGGTADFCGLIDLSIDGNRTHQSEQTHHGVAFASTSSPSAGDSFFDMHHVIRNVRVYRAGSDGFHFTGRSGIEVTNAYAQQCNGYGFFSTYDTDYVNCYADSAGKSGFFINNGSIRLSACKSYLSGTLDGLGAGFELGGNASGTAMAAVEAQNNRGPGFLLNGCNSVNIQGIADSNNTAGPTDTASTLPGAGTGTYSGVQLVNSDYNVLNIVCWQSTQGGSRIGDQNTALAIDAASTSNTIHISHRAASGTTVSSAITSGSSVDASNFVSVNGAIVSGASSSNVDATARSAASAAATQAALARRPYGLAVGRGGCTVPASPRGHVGFDQNDLTSTTITYREFYPLTDPMESVVLPVFGNFQGVTGYGGDWTFGCVPLTIGFAVETSDGALVQATFNGQYRGTCQPGAQLIPDAPLAFGSQVVANDKYNNPIAQTGVWVRVYVSVPAQRTDTVTTTSGNSVVLDSSVQATDLGRFVTGTGYPANTTYVGAVTAGTSFTIYSTATQAAVNATASGTSATFLSCIPQNLGAYALNDAVTTGTGADLTIPGSGAVSGGAASYMYGPMLLLGRQHGAPLPIVGIWSDSIGDGYPDDFHSTNYGAAARAAQNLGLPFVKLARGGESAAQISTATNRKFRGAFLDGITHLVLSAGTNDGALTTGAGSAGVTLMQTRLLAAGNFFASLGIKVYIATLPPRDTSTDAFATTTNQTPVAGSQIAGLATLNDWIRTVPTPFSGVLEMADLFMSARNSGLWAAGATTDGIHPSDAISRGTLTAAFQTLFATFTV